VNRLLDLQSNATSSLWRCVSVLARRLSTDFAPSPGNLQLPRRYREELPSDDAGDFASMVSAGISCEVAADGPGLGPKAFSVKSARTSCPGAPSKGQMRTMTGNLSMRGTMTGSKAKESRRVAPSIDRRVFESVRRQDANEQPPILNIDVLVENGVGRGVHVGDKSVLSSAIAGARISSAIGDAAVSVSHHRRPAISIKRCVKDSENALFLTRRLQTSESISK